MEQETIKMEEMRKQPSKLEVIGAVLTVGVLGFWFGVGSALGAKMVNSIEELISDNKMAEEPQQVTTKEPQQIMKEPQRVTTKNPKKVEVGKRLAAHNRKKREAKKREKQAKLEARGVNQYYGIGAVIALGVIGGLGYYIYRTKKVEQPQGKAQQNNPKQHPQTQPQSNKFEID